MGIEENIVPGKILYLSVSFPHESNSHNKFFAVVGSGKFPLLLKINTVKSESEITTRFRERQFKLRVTDYPFLEYDSYLDCGTVWSNLISLDEIIKQLQANPNRIKGEIKEPHKNEIIRLTGQSKSIETRLKRKITAELTSKKS